MILTQYKELKYCLLFSNDDVWEIDNKLFKIGVNIEKAISQYTNYIE